MEKAACRRALGPLLQREFDDSVRLLEVLGNEQTALGSRNVGAIEALTRDKQTQLAQIEQTARERTAITQSAGFAPDGDGMRALLRWCDNDGSLTRAWKQLLNQARRCRDQNLVNGALIETSRRHTRQALGILRGTTVEDAIYNPHGATAPGVDSRSLAKA